MAELNEAESTKDAKKTKKEKKMEEKAAKKAAKKAKKNHKVTTNIENTVISPGSKTVANASSQSKMNPHFF